MVGMLEKDKALLEKCINSYLYCNDDKVGKYLARTDISNKRKRWDIYWVVNSMYRNTLTPALWEYKDVHIDTALKSITTLTD